MLIVRFVGMLVSVWLDTRLFYCAQKIQTVKSMAHLRQIFVEKNRMFRRSNFQTG